MGEPPNPAPPSGSNAKMVGCASVFKQHFRWCLRRGAERGGSYLASAIAKGLRVIKIEGSSRRGMSPKRAMDMHGRETHDMLHVQELGGGGGT